MIVYRMEAFSLSDNRLVDLPKNVVDIISSVNYQNIPIHCSKEVFPKVS